MSSGNPTFYRKESHVLRNERRRYALVSKEGYRQEIDANKTSQVPDTLLRTTKPHQRSISAGRARGSRGMHSISNVDQSGGMQWVGCDGGGGEAAGRVGSWVSHRCRALSRACLAQIHVLCRPFSSSQSPSHRLVLFCAPPTSYNGVYMHPYGFPSRPRTRIATNTTSVLQAYTVTSPPSSTQSPPPVPPRPTLMPLRLPTPRGPAGSR